MKDTFTFKNSSATLLHTSELQTEERSYGHIIVFDTSEKLLKKMRAIRATFRPGTQTIGHYHLNSEEAYIVEQGSATMVVWHYQKPHECRELRIMSGDYVTIPTGYVHRVYVTSREDFVCLVISAPPFDPSDQFFPE